MLTTRYLPNRIVCALSVVFFVARTGAALAEQLCFPRCDYTHYYGPYDFSYEQPGLFGYPQCGAQGDCAPHLAYTTGALQPIRTGRIIVRLPRVMAPRHP